MCNGELQSLSLFGNVIDKESAAVKLNGVAGARDEMTRDEMNSHNTADRFVLDIDVESNVIVEYIQV